MDRKKVWLPMLLGAVAVVLFAALLLNGRDEPEERPTLTRPAVQSQTVPTTLPGQATAPETSASGPVETEQTTGPTRTEPAEQTEPSDPGPKPTEPENTRPVQTEPPAENEGMFPAVLEGGSLTVQSLFQFTGMNPDADDRFGEDIAGIELTNTSGVHMTEAEVTVIMTDGTVLTFLAEDVPAGRTVMAFSTDHSSVKDLRACEEVYGYAVFDNSDPLQSDLVKCTVDGIAITVRNVSGRELNDLNVICHELLDTSCYGGTTYQYHVSTLPAGASTVIYAEDCFLGMVEVVRVSLGS